MRYISLLLLQFGVFCSCSAQLHDSFWTFGDSAGLSFADDTFSSAQRTSFASIEGGSSVCDGSGNLLFYSNGILAWNRSHDMLLNGDSLGAGPPIAYGNGSTVTQGVLIIPNPSDSNKYYIITNSICCPFPGDEFRGLQFSVVDMSLDGGQGGIVEEIKNVPLLNDSLSEKLNAVKHANGRDWWIVTSHAIRKEFIIFLLTSDSINVQSIQTIGDSSLNFIRGELAFSYFGNYAAFATQGLELFDFDRCNGVFSNCRVLDYGMIEPGEVYYGVEFSPDESKLYASHVSNGLFQFDLSEQDTSLIKALVLSKPANHEVGQLQLGPDSRIYVSFNRRHPTLPIPYTPLTMNLSVIRFPNKKFPACAFDTMAISLEGRRTLLGLPNFPNYRLGPLTGSPCDTLSTAITEEAWTAPELLAYPNPAADQVVIRWDWPTYGQGAYTVVSSTGQVVLSGAFAAHSSQLDISVKDLAAGLYVVNLQGGEAGLGSVKLQVVR